MSLDLSDAIRAQLAGQRLRCSPLLFMDFNSAAQRLWPGQSDLIAGGFVWTGAANILMSIDFGKPSVNGSAEQFSVSVSGVSANFIAKARAQQSEAMGRRLQISNVIMGEDWQPLAAPFVIRTGRMLGFSYRAQGVTSRALTVRCETLCVARSLPPLTFLSQDEQQKRFPGDLGLAQIPALMNKTVTWPK